MTNDSESSENELGVREIGSALTRLVDLQEAKDGSANLVTLHANVWTVQLALNGMRNQVSVTTTSTWSDGGI